MKRKPKHFSNVEVIDIGDKGRAIGRTPEGRIVLVEQAVPGDVVNVVSVQKKKGMFITVPTDYIQRSAHRSEPFCQHFGTCGGCKWQNLQYSRQLYFKEKAVRDALGRISGLNDPRVHPILGCSSERYYRNKLEFTFTDERWLTEEEIKSQEDFDRRGLGFHISGQFARVLDIRECYLQPDPSDAIRLFIRGNAIRHDIPFQNIRTREGLLRNLIIRNNGKGELMVALIMKEDDIDARSILLDPLIGEFSAIKSLYYAINPKVNDSIYDLDFQLYAGEPKLRQQLGHVEFELGPKSFFQTNTDQALRLYQVAAKMAALKGDEVVFDLYTGVGSIALFIAHACRSVLGIEEVEAAIHDARANAELNGISNAKFVTGDVRRILNGPEADKYGRPDVLITDPPRAGMHADVVQSIRDLGPDKVVYISCNPSTQARDIALMKEEYDFIEAQPVDMFPHTSHIENVALLRRKH